MKNLSIRNTDKFGCRLIVCATLSFLLAASSHAADLPQSFKASFDVLRNEKQLGETHLEFVNEGDGWQLDSKTKGTRGVARWLGLDESSHSYGNWKSGQPVPIEMTQTAEIAIKKIRTTATFDWPNSTVLSTHKDGQDTLPLQPDVLDSASAGISIRTGLVRGDTQWQLMVLDEDEIKPERFEVARHEQIQTPLGCMKTVMVEKIRGPESTRYTQTWYAVDFGFVPVQFSHGKTDGDAFTTSIQSLTVGGKEVTALGECEP